MTHVKPSRELSAAEIVNRSFGLYSTGFVYFFLPFLFAGIANGVFGWIVTSHLPSFPEPSTVPEETLRWLASHLGTIIGLLVLSGLVSWIVITVANGVAVKYTSDLLEKGEASLQESFNFAISRLPSLLAGGAITGILVFLGVLCLVVPGVIIAIMLALVVPVIIIEQKDALDSLGRSRRLTSNRWGKTFVLLFLVFVISVILGLVGNAIGDIFAPSKTFVSAIVSAFVQPIYPLSLTLLYYSMAAREGPLAPPSPPTAPPTFPLKFCPQCGEKLIPEAIFCPNCGKKVKD